jgi:UDP-N-acetylmuramate: L-alanyl-gamma-D-glutamyl-meso-diaminopimelate ligase
LWAILEPRSNTLRRNVFFKELVASLSVADEVVIASVFKAESIPEAERLSTTAVVKELKRQGHKARECRDADAIVGSIAPELQEGDVVAILSNGGFGGIYEKLPSRLAQRG